MAGYYDKNKDYSLEIVKAQRRGASQAEIDRLRRERQNKIDTQYEGKDPYKGKNDIMGNKTQGYIPPAQRDRETRDLRDGGTIPARNGAGPIRLTSPWRPDVDYAAQAEKYADQGDWEAVDDVLMRRQYKIDAQGGNDRGLSNRDLWNRLRRERGLDRDLPLGPEDSRPAYRPEGSFGGYHPSYRPGKYPGGGYHPDGGFGGFSSGADALLEAYRQQAALAEAELKAKFEADMAGIRAHYQSMDGLYDQLRNQQAAQSDLEKLRMNELGLGQGLNTGAFGQLALGHSSQYQNAFADIGRREAAEKAQGSWKLQQLESAYRGAVAESHARNQAELMDKLYREYVRQMEAEERRRREEADRADREHRYRYQLEADRADADHRAALDRAKTLAQHGDFSGYAVLGYSREEIAEMKKNWQRQQAKKRR